MRKITRTKKGELIFDYPTKLILGIGVIVLVALFLFKINLANYAKNLPQNTYNDTDSVVDYTSLTPDQLTALNCKQENWVALLGDTNVGSGWWWSGDVRAIGFFSDDKKTAPRSNLCVIIDKELYSIVDCETKKIKLGEIKNGIVAISEQDSANLGKDVSQADLDKLYGTKLVANRLICSPSLNNQNEKEYKINSVTFLVGGKELSNDINVAKIYYDETDQPFVKTEQKVTARIDYIGCDSLNVDLSLNQKGVVSNVKNLLLKDNLVYVNPYRLAVGTSNFHYLDQGSGSLIVFCIKNGVIQERYSSAEHNEFILFFDETNYNKMYNK